MTNLELPELLFCPTDGLKSEKLNSMGLVEDFLKPHFITYHENFNLTDIDLIWGNGTFQRNDFDLTWIVEDGN